MADGSEPTLHQLGEFAVIDRLNTGRLWPAAVRVGPGDDAAVVDAPDGRVAVSTDMLVEGRHFRRDWSEAADIGHKAAAEKLEEIRASMHKPE